ncbi:DUF2971 domain-containing protein [Pseudomonas syringae]|uniref:DUF2971 domain-containing protein n=1 Tax=Pseudomonas syringae pv. syringae TaxID=321 RepID=A0AB35JPZ2_PSESY|nr:DUF2971 domain-containing protein [Pseudomonas syringae]MCF5737629.1 DUF2971 domain-containing protein [Pseudomonas syringae]MCF5742496.1 DUF2971 domain-containing protein [Pseudomonas syringae]MCF5752897.1 DUF2971 domain-containing protein [Pseudomonas syringae]MCF5758178.1 DUF2971 domain-containing protein [Pseudomonas syringae]MDC3738123.1 DUF2971 domain-containing protein [Pseudomonas syringae pv. syringae]
MISPDEPRKLYRIMDFTKVVQIFESETLYFANPSVWDDPYEQMLKHPMDHAIFAQCWGRLSISDAMWRIYSRNGMGVRIATTPTKLRATIKESTKIRGLKYRLKPVQYKSKLTLDREAKKIETDLKATYTVARAVDMLYMKRDAFRHETEWRAAIYSASEDRTTPKSGIAIPVDPHFLIENIMLDPRAPGELIDAFKFYFEKKLRFAGNVSRSALYKTPKTITVNGEEISIDML